MTKKARAFKLQELVQGGIKKGIPIEVSHKDLVKAFRSLGIKIEDYAYFEYGSLSISIKWEKDKAIITFY